MSFKIKYFYGFYLQLSCLKMRCLHMQLHTPLTPRARLRSLPKHALTSEFTQLAPFFRIYRLYADIIRLAPYDQCPTT